MKINTAYFTKEALVSFRRNWIQSMAAITTVALCLAVVGVILVTIFIGSQLIKKVESQVEIEVYLKDNAPLKRIQAFQQILLSWSEVKKVDYISKDEALKKFKQDFKNQPEVLENLSGNPLPASYRISLKEPRQVSVVAKRIKKQSQMEQLVENLESDIKYGKEYVNKLFAFTRRISFVAGGFASLLIFVSLVLITNTIRLAIFARRKEIGIMKLVGASNWFIRWPFLLEGMFEGLIGAVVAILLLFAIYRTFFENLAKGRLLAFLAVPLDQGTFLRLVFLLALSGLLIGAMGSAIALRRFLKV